MNSIEKNQIQLYKSKDLNYFSHARKDIQPLLQAQYQKVLEIGCGSGQTLEWLKSNGYCEWAGGVEPYAPNPNSKLIDEFWRLDIEQKIPDLPDKSIDLLLFLDVLEHLRDPWTTLQNLSKLVKDDGQIIISLPNIRNYRIVFDLFFKGKFNYSNDGILDRTHLRFFTYESAVQLIELADFTVTESLSPEINRAVKKFLSKIGLKGILPKQFIFSAKK
jgi:SAM-dependent methyltransferase